MRAVQVKDDVKAGRLFLSVYGKQGIEIYWKLMMAILLLIVVLLGVHTRWSTFARKHPATSMGMGLTSYGERSLIVV